MKPAENLVLVAFGKNRLVDMIDMIGDENKEEELLNLSLGKHLPPVYRPEKACSEEEKLAFLEYISWLSNLIEMYNKEKINV